MSIFSKWFKLPQYNIEREVEEMYSQMFSQLSDGMTLKQAREKVKEAIKLCKKEAKKEGTANLPDNYGDLLIQAAETGDPKAKKIVDKARKEGATYEDIREFWNLSDLIRRMVRWSENVFRTSMAMSLWKPGLSKDEEKQIATEIRKSFPMYGDPDDTRVTIGDDRPLPHELKARVDRWRIKLISVEGEEKIKEKINKYSSFNALVRDEIRKGNL
ncbi:MAG: hypothetical protein MUP17_02010 [candidate division Zixibacteria bacterium]|nr:hypothetical protein [candidate division Zixibacteria bacterium]